MKVWSCIFLVSLFPFLAAAENYKVFEENGKFGLKTQQGQILIPAAYEALGWSDGTLTILNGVTGYQAKGLWGLIKVDNHRVTKAEFTELLPSESSLIIAHKKSDRSLRVVAGCVNTSGKVVIPFQYDGLKISALRAVVLLRSGIQYKYGLIDLENKLLIPTEYQRIYSIGSLRYAVENFQNKTALFTDNGKQITVFSIDSISSFQKNFAVIYQQLQQGLIDRDGQIKIEPTYREVKIQEDGSVHVRQSDEWSFLDGQNNLLQKIQADSVVALGQNLFKLEQATQIQLVNEKLKPVGNSAFSFLGKFMAGKAIYSLGNKVGLIREDGTAIVEPKFDRLVISGNSIIANQRSGGKDQWMLLDTVGNRKHSKSYDQILAFNGNFFPAKIHGYWGAINQEGKEIIACVHDSLEQSLGENVVVKFRGQYGIINLEENWLVTPQENPIRLISEDRFLTFTARALFLESFDGNIIYFSSNKLEVEPDFLVEHLPSGALWKIDFDGRIISRQVQHDEPIEKVFPESEGLRAIQKNGQFGFIDARGRLRIANRYDDIKPFTEELAAAKIRGKWGFINHEDKIAIQPAYEEVSSFQNGLSIVKQKGFYGMIDKSGKQILQTRYETLKVLPNHRLLITQDGFFGLADSDGKILINPKYNGLEDLSNGYVIVKRDGKFGLLTVQGISTIPLIYDVVTFDPYGNRYMALKKSEWTQIKM